MAKNKNDEIIKELLEHVPEDLKEQVELTFRRSKFDDDADPVFAMSLHLLFLQLAFKTGIHHFDERFDAYGDKLAKNLAGIEAIHRRNVFWMRLQLILSFLFITTIGICVYVMHNQWTLPRMENSQNIDTLMSNLRAALLVKLSTGEYGNGMPASTWNTGDAVCFIILCLLSVIILIQGSKIIQFIKMLLRSVGAQNKKTEFQNSISPSIVEFYIKEEKEKTNASINSISPELVQEELNIPLPETPILEKNSIKKDIPDSWAIRESDFDLLNGKEQRRLMHLLEAIKKRRKNLPEIPR